MILTGKAKEDFYNFCKNKGLENFHNKSYALEVCKTFWNALIIEWFDSVGIYINVGGVLMDNNSNFSFDIQQNNTLNGLYAEGIKTRQEAKEQAIIKADEIYNER